MELESAAYDPATLTVTLTPTNPLIMANDSLVVRSSDSFPVDLLPPTTSTKLPTDLQGNALAGWIVLPPVKRLP